MKLGYAVLMVNYRGSLGNGDDGIYSLVGEVGKTDLEDCIAALDLCIKEQN